jgi:uncharacterized protein (TIGR03435 family)
MIKVRDSRTVRALVKLQWPMIGIFILATSMGTPPVHSAQSTGSTNTATSKDDFRFEVFSIKKNKSISMSGGDKLLPNGYHAGGLTLWQLIMLAYVPQPPIYWLQVKMQNLPDWGVKEYYDIDARIADKDIPAWKAQTGSKNDLLRAALRNALKDQCKLAVHLIPIEIPYYSIVVGKQGAKLNVSAPGTQVQGVGLSYGGVMTITQHDGIQVRTFHAATMKSLAAILTISSPYHPVQDKTGLNGQYDFSLQERNSGDQTDGTQLSNWPINHLGLELKPDKGPSYTPVIDHIERPNSN